MCGQGVALSTFCSFRCFGFLSPDGFAACHPPSLPLHRLSPQPNNASLPPTLPPSPFILIRFIGALLCWSDTCLALARARVCVLRLPFCLVSSLFSPLAARRKCVRLEHPTRTLPAPHRRPGRVLISFLFCQPSSPPNRRRRVSSLFRGNSRDFCGRASTESNTLTTS